MFYFTTERPVMALKEIGPAVFNGGFSTFLAFVLLANSNSYGFSLFFRVSIWASFQKKFLNLILSFFWLFHFSSDWASIFNFDLLNVVFNKNYVHSFALIWWCLIGYSFIYFTPSVTGVFHGGSVWAFPWISVPPCGAELVGTWALPHVLCPHVTTATDRDG